MIQPTASQSAPLIEDIVLRYSGRGMNILKDYLDSGYCRHAAEEILKLERGNVLLTTGFCVSGVAETDGPPGTFALAHALDRLGFTPTIVTDKLCKGLFECSAEKEGENNTIEQSSASPSLIESDVKNSPKSACTYTLCESDILSSQKNTCTCSLYESCDKSTTICPLSRTTINTEYVDVTADARDFQKLLDKYHPVCLISIERCGRNVDDDYANMRGISIASQTACIDVMFEMAARHGILTIGVGDGGNEIGMGNLKDVISEKLSLVPCDVTVDELIIATVSNWGAYALVSYLELLEHQHIMLSYEELEAYLNSLISKGCIDGVSKKPEPSVDGFSLAIEKEIISSLAQTTAEATGA